MDLQALQDGTFLLGEVGTNRIVRCTLAGFVCKPFADMSGKAGRFFKFHYDSADDAIYVASTHSNKVLRFSPPSGEPVTVADSGVLYSPNEIRLDGAGALWVADTDRKRIVALSVEVGATNKVISEISGSNQFTTNRFPLDFARNAAGELWVLLSDHAYLNGIVVRYDVKGKAVQRVKLPTISDPIAVEALKDRAVIADIKGFALYLISDGQPPVVFGDSRYREYLSSRARISETAGGSQHVALGFVIAGALLALGVAIWSGVDQRRVSRGSGDGSTANADGAALSADLARATMARLDTSGQTHWVQPAARYRMLARMFVLLVVAYLSSLVVAAYLFFDIDGRPEVTWPVIGALLGTGLVVGITAIQFNTRSRWRIGTNGAELFIRDHYGGLTRAIPEQIVYTRMVARIGSKFVNIRDGYGRTLFDEQGFVQHIEPMLQRGTQISKWRMTLMLLRAGDLFHWAILILFVMIVLIELGRRVPGIGA